LADYLNGRAFTDADFTNEGLPVIRIRQLVDPQAEVNRFNGVVRPSHLLADGDLVFSWSGSLAVRIWDRGPAVLNQHLFRVDPRPGINRSYLRWVLEYSLPTLTSQMHGSAMTHITTDALRRVRVPVPSLAEQADLARSLNDLVRPIDAVLGLRERQEPLIKERESAEVSRRLDDLRATSPSTRLRWIVRESDERAAGASASDLLSVSIHRGVIPRSEMTEDEPRADSLDGYKIVNAGDIVLNRMRAFQGAVGVARVNGIVSPDYAVLRPAGGVGADFLHFVMRSDWFVGEMVRFLRGVGSAELGAARTPRVNVSDLMQIAVPTPDNATQERFVAESQAAAARSRAITERLSEHTHLLRELRYAAIAEAIERGAPTTLKDRSA
jgi:type I restriction enzyme S subunit